MKVVFFELLTFVGFVAQSNFTLWILIVYKHLIIMDKFFLPRKALKFSLNVICLILTPIGPLMQTEDTFFLSCQQIFIGS